MVGGDNPGPAPHRLATHSPGPRDLVTDLAAAGPLGHIHLDLGAVLSLHLQAVRKT